VPQPVVLSTLRSRINLHVMASWIWDAGGDFITADGKQVTFDDPKAMLGMRHYFQLGKYMLENRNRITDLESDRLFLSGEAAAAFSGPWVPIDTTMPAIVRDNLGMMAMPGASFVGGTHLLTWKHTRNREMTLALADFLVKRSAEYNIFPAYGLPAYVPGWDQVHFIAEPYFSTLLDALQRGRSFPSGQLWGLVEKRLVDAIPIVWERVLNADEKEIDKILGETLVPLAERINMTLE
jgi:multiple sugar transport system substrate-binding protein